MAGSVAKLVIDIVDTLAYPLTQGIEPFGRTAALEVIIRVRIQGRGKQGLQITVLRGRRD